MRKKRRLKKCQEGKSWVSESNESKLPSPNVRDLGEAKYLITKIITGKVSHYSY